MVFHDAYNCDSLLCNVSKFIIVIARVHVVSYTAYRGIRILTGFKGGAEQCNKTRENHPTLGRGIQ